MRLHSREKLLRCHVLFSFKENVVSPDIFCRKIAALFLLLCIAAETLAGGVDHVFIVSFDGGKPAVMRDSNMLVFKDMQRQGACTSAAFTVVPSYTLVAHASMLTGVQPNKHLIDWNDWQPAKGPVQVPTIFALAKKKGLTTGLIAGKTKFKHFEIPNSLDLFSAGETSALAVAKTAAEFIVTQKPNLTFMHFADSDNAGHSYGWGSDEQKRAFADQDAALQILRRAVAEAGIEKNSVFILTADHGGHGYGHGTTDLDDMHIPWVAWGKDVKPGVLTRRVDIHDTAATALWLLGVRVPRQMDGRPVREAFYRR
jgi:predicted AlkP superfamily pyrophosphatase or phosphodiesterase